MLGLFQGTHGNPTLFKGLFSRDSIGILHFFKAFLREDSYSFFKAFLRESMGFLFFFKAFLRESMGILTFFKAFFLGNP